MVGLQPQVETGERRFLAGMRASAEKDQCLSRMADLIEKGDLIRAGKDVRAFLATNPAAANIIRSGASG